MKSRWFPVLVAMLTLALFSSLSVPVAAAAPTVDLVLGGSGATPWTISNIVPGNSGTKTVTLSNTGSENGVVTIWISTIVNTEGPNPEPETGNTAEPGELGNYLLLNVSGPNLVTNFTLPTIISNFPNSAASPKHIRITPLNAHSTLTLQWHWQLPPEVGNDVQGDILSFSINYTLEETPPVTSPPPVGGGGGGSVPLPSPDPPGAAPQLELGVTISLISCSDTLMMGSEGDYIIQVTNESETDDLHNLMIIGLIPGEMILISAEGPISFTKTDQGIRFEPLSVLPPGKTVEYYLKLKAIAPGTAVLEAGIHWDEYDEMIVTQTSITIPDFTPPIPSPPSSSVLFRPLPPQADPADFEVCNLKIDPVQANPGEYISINCEVVNNGGQSGEYTLFVDIPGLLQTSRLIRLEAGQAKAFTLTLPPVGQGTYQVNIGGVSGTFSIGAFSPAPSGTQDFTKDWLIQSILLFFGVAGLVWYAIVVLMRRRK